MPVFLDRNRVGRFIRQPDLDFRVTQFIYRRLAEAVAAVRHRNP